MTTPVVFVHGIRTSATMWRAQVNHLAARGIPATACDLPGHGTRMAEPFTLTEARRTIDEAVLAAAALGPVLLVGHSMGGLLSLDRAGTGTLPLTGVVAASCTARPSGVGLRLYRRAIGAFDLLPDRGLALTRFMLARTLPESTRADFGAGGYAFDAQHVALPALAELDVLASVAAIDVPLWFVNGSLDQLRIEERRFLRAAPQAHLAVIGRAHHLVTAMRPDAFNEVLDEALRALS